MSDIPCVRSLRAERGWSLTALAARLDISRQTVNAIEIGKYQPSLPLAFRIAHAFGKPIEKVFPEEGQDEEHRAT